MKKEKLNPRYFSHDTQAQNDFKIISLISRYGIESYGMFWILVELMHYYNGNINIIALEGISNRFNIEYETLRDIINFCVTLGLFYRDGDSVRSNRVDENLELMELTRMDKSRAGKIGAEVRTNNKINKQL